MATQTPAKNKERKDLSATTGRFFYARYEKLLPPQTKLKQNVTNSANWQTANNYLEKTRISQPNEMSGMANKKDQKKNSPSHFATLKEGLYLVVIFSSGALVLFSPSCEKITPPAHQITLDEFRRQMPAPKRLYIDKISKCIIWIGPVKNATASGPAMYVFDEHHELLDWSEKTGEGEKLKGLSNSYDNLVKVSLEEILASK